MNMKCSDTSYSSVDLILSGSSWHIYAGDAEAAAVVHALGQAMSLNRFNATQNTSSNQRWQELIAVIDNGTDRTPAENFASGRIFCLLPRPENHDLLISGMLIIAQAIARAEVSRGGLLIHGALVKVPGKSESGIILAGPSAVGKTTASKRLPLPWQPLSDDTSLIERDERGHYIAHPWPTWSHFYSSPEGKPGTGGSWDVQTGLPLQAIFFLEQADQDQVDTLSTASATAFLMQTVQHVTLPMARDLSPGRVQPLHQHQLAVAEEIIRAIPAYTLQLCTTGAFWVNITDTLAGFSSAAPVQQVTGSRSQGNSHAPARCVFSSFLPDKNNIVVNYSGNSMEPTLRYPDIIEVVPYENSPIRSGDVIYYPNPAGGAGVIHRVVRVAAKGIYTRGDNNNWEDPYTIQPTDVTGQVTTAWQNNRPRKIAGGVWGKLTSIRIHFSRRLKNAPSSMLQGEYSSPALRWILRRIIPSLKKPRIFEFKHRYQPSILKLMINGHVIGQYDAWQQLWVINHPWKYIIDESKLPTVPGAPYMDRQQTGKNTLRNHIS